MKKNQIIIIGSIICVVLLFFMLIYRSSGGKSYVGDSQISIRVESGITLPSSDTDSTALDNGTYGPPNTLDIYGYGFFSNSTNVFTQRRKVTAPIPAFLPRLAHTSLYGAVAGGSTTVFCPGDDGGPVIATINGSKTLAGVVVAPDGDRFVVSANKNMQPQFIINNATGCSNYAIYATFAGSGIRAFLDSIKNLGN